MYLGHGTATAYKKALLFDSRLNVIAELKSVRASMLQLTKFWYSQSKVAPVVFVSGRSDRVRRDTEDWLEREVGLRGRAVYAEGTPATHSSLRT
jgi:hypothetical protein